MNVHKVPEGVDDLDAVLLTDILPTAWCAMHTNIEATAPGSQDLDVGTGLVGQRCEGSDTFCESCVWGQRAWIDCCCAVCGMIMLLLLLLLC